MKRCGVVLRGERGVRGLSHDFKISRSGSFGEEMFYIVTAKIVCYLNQVPT